MLPIVVSSEPVSKVKGVKPSRIRNIAEAAITVASIEERPSSAQ